MQLCYRGIAYQTNLPELATTEGKVIGKYRGAKLRKRIVVGQVNHVLNYGLK